MEIKQLRKGTDYTLDVSLQNPDGTVKDLSGTISIYASLNKYPWEDPILEIIEEVTIVNSEEGKLEIVLKATTIDTLEYRLYYLSLNHKNALSQNLSIPLHAIEII